MFTLDEAHTLEELAALAGNLEALEALCVHPRSLLPEMPSVTGDAMALGRLRNGAQANLPEFSQAPLVKVFAGQTGAGGDCEAGGGNAVSAGGGDGVKQGQG